MSVPRENSVAGTLLEIVAGRHTIGILKAGYEFLAWFFVNFMRIICENKEVYVKLGQVMVNLLFL